MEFINDFLKEKDLRCYCWWLLYNEYMLKKDWYRDVVMLPFENIRILIPIEFEKS